MIGIKKLSVFPEPVPVATTRFLFFWITLPNTHLEELHQLTAAEDRKATAEDGERLPARGGHGGGPP